MATTDYLPADDAGLLNWTDQFSTKITATPTDFGLSAPIATSYATKQSAYATAYAAANDPATRGKHTIMVKDETRDDLIAYTRLVVGQVQGTMTVTPEQKSFLGITVKDTEPTPINPPTEPPVMKVASMNGWTAHIKLRGLESDRRGKPDGVAGANIYTFVGETAPTDVDDWDFEGDTSKADFTVNFKPELEAGTKVWITACWKNPRFQTGPACTPVPLMVGGGVTGMAA